MLIAGVWLEINADVYWRSSAILAVIAVAFAHSLALLSIPLAEYSWLKTTTLVSIFALANLLCYLFIIEFNQTPSRLLTVLSILVALQTVIIPILAKIKKSEVTRQEKLILFRQNNGSYQSSDGHYFNVIEISKPYTDS